MKDYYDGGRSFSSYIVDCQFKDKCISANSYKCHSCRHNKGKRDYYEPEPYRPFPVPWIPSPNRPTWVINYTPRTRTMKTPYFSD
jgi:hypothetical protein